MSAPTGRLPEPVEAAVYFVCAEALTNAAKHSRATRAGCAVRVDRRRVRVEIADDGWAAPIPPADRACTASPTASKRRVGRWP